MAAHPERPEQPGLTEVVPHVARVAAVGYVRALGWTARAQLAVGQRVVRGVREGESPGELLQNSQAELRHYARRVLGLPEHESARSNGAATSTTVVVHQPGGVIEAQSDDTVDALRRRGADLLARSADVGDDDQTHPAYARILDELAPDEARILRYMARTGAQAAVDVRTNRLPLNVGSMLVSPGLTMIAAEAGLRHETQIHAFLNNLFRLGLVWFSREPLPDPLAYQVLEAQPDVITAMRKEGRAKTIRRSIMLTPFGEDFCRTCLPA